MKRRCQTCRHWTKRTNSDNGDCDKREERRAPLSFTAPEYYCARWRPTDMEAMSAEAPKAVSKGEQRKLLRENAYLHEKRRELEGTIAELRKQLREKRNEVVRLRTALLHSSPRPRSKKTR